jgi:glycosyltransferase involved in cell wall biosynthesis
VRRIALLSVLREEKRADVFVSAAARIAAERPEVEFIIAGEGPCRQPLIDQARQLGVLDRFHFPGYRDDVPQVLAEVDAFVLPSRTEAFPNAVQEAMAAGLPVVASAVGGVVELVRDGRTGHLVPPGDPNALAMALLDLIDHPERATAFGAAARREVEERYSFQRMVAQFEELYLSTLAGTRRHADVAAAAA